MNPLQTLQEQRKAEFENGFVGPENHIGQNSYAEFSIEDVKSFISETARLGYELGRQSNIEGWKDTNKDAYRRGKIAGLEEAKSLVEKIKVLPFKPEFADEESLSERSPEYVIGLEDGARFVEHSLSSLITTNQEKV